MGMDDWSIGRRLAVGFAAILALLAVIAGVYVYGEQRRAETNQRLTQQVMPRADAANELAKAYLTHAAATRDYVRSGTPQHLTAYYEALDRSGVAVSRLESLPKTAQGDEIFRQMQPLASEYLRATERAVQLRQAGNLEGAAAAIDAEMIPTRDRLLAKTEEFIRWQFAQRDSAVEESARIQAEMFLYSIVLLLLVLVISVAVAIQTARSIQGPAAQLVSASRSLIGGDFDSAIRAAATIAGPRGEASDNETRELASVFESMSRSLQQRERRLVAQAKLSAALASSMEPEKLGAEALREIAAYAGVEVGQVYAYDGESDLLRLVAGYSVDGASEELRVGDGIPGEAAASRRTIVVRDIPADAPFRVRFGFDELPPRAIVASPMVVQDALVGVLAGGSVRAMSDDVVDFVSGSAQQLAVSLQNAMAHRQVERLAEELQDRNERLQAQNEEIQAQSEEIQAQNEELQAQSEELQAQNEELLAQSEQLQAQSEELQVQNQQMQTYSGELAGINLRLQQQRELLKTILARIPEAVQVTDGSGRVIISNPAAKELFGEQPVWEDDDEGEIGTGELSGTDGPQVWEPTLRALDGEAVLSEEMVVRNRETGRERDVLVSAVPLLSDGRITNVITVATDISEIKEVDRLKDEFVSIAAHELKSPLTALKGFAQLLERKLSPHQADVSVRRSLHTISSQSDRIVKLVDRLLDMSRAQMGRLEMRPEEVDICELVRQQVGQAQIKSERHRVAANVQCEDVTGRWDRGYLEQVLDNLLDNAIRYSPQGGDVTVTVSAENGLARITVADNGIGMSSDTISRLFKRYYRSEGAKKVEAGGMGIGLYVAREMVALHGGRILVESEEGRGSRFTVELPLPESVEAPVRVSVTAS
jgi:two-component system, OmpR family, phosphate regulon sensor histidine kinase PhoR